MRIKLESSDTLLHIYACLICKKDWVSRDEDRPYKCPTDHSDGSCCHYGESEVPRGNLFSIFDAVGKSVGEDNLLKNLSDQGDLPNET